MIAFYEFSGYDIIIHCETGIFESLVRNQIFSFYLFDVLFDKMIQKNSGNNKFLDSFVINFHIPTLVSCRGIKSMRHPVMRQIRVK